MISTIYNLLKEFWNLWLGSIRLFIPLTFIRCSQRDWFLWFLHRFHFQNIFFLFFVCYYNSRILLAHQILDIIDSGLFAFIGLVLIYILRIKVAQHLAYVVFALVQLTLWAWRAIHELYLEFLLRVLLAATLSQLICCDSITTRPNELLYLSFLLIDLSLSSYLNKRIGQAICSHTVVLENAVLISRVEI